MRSSATVSQFKLMNAFVSGVMSVSSASRARQFSSGFAFFASYACENMRMVRAMSARRTVRRTAGECLFPGGGPSSLRDRCG